MAGKILKYLLKPTSFAIRTNSKSMVQSKASAPNPMALTITKEEPTSPRVSCMGQVSRHKKDKSKKKEKKTKKNKKQHDQSAPHEEVGVDDDDNDDDDGYNRWCKAKKLMRVQGRQKGDVVLMMEADLAERKEVNLWKRRTHLPPNRLEVPTY